MASHEIALAGLEEESIVDGPGLRLVLFTQGCPHACPGCHNPETHPFTGGTVYSLEQIVQLYTENPLLSGVTFSGGEPFLHAHVLSLLAQSIHSLGGSVVTYTGYTYEELLDTIARDQRSDMRTLLDESDLLIDGPYIEAKRDLTLLFRGSSNQRILDRASRLAIDAHRSPLTATTNHD